MGNIVMSDNPSASQVDVTGGKGASLAKLAALGFRVPEFFTIAVPAFTEMAGDAGAGTDEVFLKELHDAYDALGGDGAALAVRSSAIGEDSAERSFAGLYHTSLGVRGFDNLVAAVETCWRSYDNPAAQHYRDEGEATGPAGMAVVVQRLIEGEWSGVAFTANPVTSVLSEVVVEAVEGLGERLVSGEVNPSQVVLRRSDGAVVRASSGRRAPPADVVREVWRQSAAVADAVGFPQDVEWTWRDGDLFLLQSRPITTVAALFYNRDLEPWKDDPAHADDPKQIWSRAYSDEIWTSPTSPLFYNIQNLSGSFAGYWKWHHDESPIPDAVFKYYKAAAYVDVDVLQRQYEYHPRFSRIVGILNLFPSQQQEAVAKAPFRWKGRLRRTWHFEREERHLRSLAHNHRYLADLWPAFAAKTDTWFDIDLDTLSMEELRAHQGAVFGEMMKAGPACGFGVAYHAHDLTFILTGLLERWFGDGDVLYAKVTSGLDDSETVAEAESIWHLARQLRAVGPEAVAAVKSGTWASVVGSPTLDGFIDSFASFLRAHRHRGASYKDLIYPRWGDDPELLFNLVKAYLDSDSPSPVEQNRAQAEVRGQTQRELLGRLRGPTALPKRQFLRWLFRYNEIYMDVRDNHRFHFDRVWYELRRIYLSFGTRIADAGVIEEPSDVFYLGVAEVEMALAGALDANATRPRMSVRKAEWHETLRNQAPKFLRGWVPFDDGEDLIDGGRVNGIGASPGSTTATARVVHRLEDVIRVEDGDILVTRQTDPGWTPVFGKIAGLVLETGGVLAHGTSLCREYGLPCVTAVEGAMRRIPDGATIRIDGSTGSILVL